MDLFFQTLEFGQMCERCGIDALIVHARHISDRPSHAAQWEQFKVNNYVLTLDMLTSSTIRIHICNIL